MGDQSLFYLARGQRPFGALRDHRPMLVSILAALCLSTSFWQASETTTLTLLKLAACSSVIEVKPFNARLRGAYVWALAAIAITNTINDTIASNA